MINHNQEGYLHLHKIMHNQLMVVVVMVVVVVIVIVVVVKVVKMVKMVEDRKRMDNGLFYRIGLVVH